MKNPTIKPISCIALSAIALAVQQARADMITYDLDTENISVTGDTTPFVSVQIDRTSSTTATITFNSLVSGSDVNLLGGPGAAAVQVNATSFTESATATANNSFSFFTSPGPFTSDTSDNNDDGYGKFNLRYSATGGYGSTATTISFTVTDTSGTWGSAANVLTDNSNGQIAAANIYIADTNDFGSGAINTGYAGDAAETNSQVPDGGSTLAMLGCVLVGLGGTRAWFARKK